MSNLVSPGIPASLQQRVQVPPPSATATASHSEHHTADTSAVFSARDRLDLSLQGGAESTVREPDATSPDDPVCVTIYDRMVQLSQGKDSQSLYAMCRRWLQNDPEAEEASAPQVLPPEVLPPPDPVDESVVPPLPGPPEDEPPEGMTIDSLRAQLKERSLAVRAHINGKKQAKAAAYTKRMNKLLAKQNCKK